MGVVWNSICTSTKYLSSCLVALSWSSLQVLTMSLSHVSSGNRHGKVSWSLLLALECFPFPYWFPLISPYNSINISFIKFFWMWHIFVGWVGTLINSVWKKLPHFWNVYILRIFPRSMNIVRYFLRHICYVNNTVELVFILWFLDLILGFSHISLSVGSQELWTLLGCSIHIKFTTMSFM